MSCSNYKVIQLCFDKETPKSNFNLVFKINPDNDYDFNMILTISNDIYVKEFEKKLSINNIISILYNNENKYDFDTKINYTLSDKPLIIEDKYERNKDIDVIISDLLLYMDNFKNKVFNETKVEEEMIILKEDETKVEESKVKEEDEIKVGESKVKEEVKEDESKVKEEVKEEEDETKV